MITQQLEKKDLHILKIDKIDRSKVKLNEYLKNNPLKYDGKYYTVTLEKQTLFYNQLTSYNILRQNNQHLLFKWHTNNNIDVEWSYEEAINFMQTMEHYINILVGQQRDYEEQIKNCQTKEEINNLEEVNYVY